MSDQAWEKLVDLIDTKYQIDFSNKRDEALEDNHKLKQTIESIEFERDNIKFKIERITSPRITDRKTFYAGHGTANRSQNIYDPEETSSRVVFYKQLTDGYFHEISPEELMADS